MNKQQARRALNRAPIPVKSGVESKITKIDLNDIWQTTYLCIKLGCTHEELAKAVRQVGDSHAKVSEFLEERIPSLW